MYTAKQMNFIRKILFINIQCQRNQSFIMGDTCSTNS